ncbi:MAG TPA: hypothetical protein VGI39_01320 [Polyangiaceae bacterium]
MKVSLSDLSVTQRRVLRILLNADGDWVGLTYGESGAAVRLVEMQLAERRGIDKHAAAWRIAEAGRALYSAEGVSTS